ncbi:MAG: shikimate dehydrogenase [Desulfobacterales bacterium]|nr:shikimate dehydrogenase [Desulfobacterales bacterium]
MKQYPEIDANTRLFAVFGDPVGHSLSPVMHNRAFRQVGYNGVYVAMRIRDIETSVAAIRCLSIQGVSVTVPHKTAVMAWLDQIDPLAAEIGAVNTIVNQNGHLCGYNTDAHGAIRALKEMVNPAGREVAIIGAGGAARAVGFGLAGENVPLVIVNRTATTGKALADKLGADYRSPNAFRPAKGSILINTTPVGMWPHVDALPLPLKHLRPDMMVMDIIYNPSRSRLLREAADMGCQVLNGVPMFVHQGALQFKLWTGKEAPLSAMHQAVKAALSGQPEPSTAAFQRDPADDRH